MKRPTPPMPPQPGELLLAGRRDNGWSAENVAGFLCLTTTQLAALERDDYANLPSKTYLLGYWRNYARLLGIDIEESINASARTLANSVSGRMQAPRAARLHGGFERAQRRSAFGFVLLAVALLGALWYWQSPLRAPESAAIDAATDTTTAIAAATEPSPAAADTTSPNQLVFAIDKPTWLEVEDAAGKRLIRRIVQRGRRLTLHGTPPFSVFIGDAAGVAVQYRGRPVELTARRRFARLRIGGQ